MADKAENHPLPGASPPASAEEPLKLLAADAFAPTLAKLSRPQSKTTHDDTTISPNLITPRPLPSLIPSSIIAASLIAGYTVVSAVQGSFERSAGTTLWQAILGSRNLNGPLLVPAFVDPTAWVIVIVLAASPVLFVRQWRQLHLLFNEATLAQISTRQREQLNTAAHASTHVLEVSNQFGGALFWVVSLVVTVLMGSAVFQAGPWHGILTALHLHGHLISHTDVTRYWWLNLHDDPVACVYFALIATYGLYAALKHIAFNLQAAWIASVLFRQGVAVPLRIDNPDGHYGLGLIRSILGGIVVTMILWLTVIGVLFFIWIGPGPVTVTVSVVVMCGSIVSLAAPMGLIAGGIRRAKIQSVAAIESQLEQLERRIGNLVNTSLGGVQSSLDSEIVLEYWRELRAKHTAILSIPTTGFRYREFLYSSVTMILVPILLLTIGALLR